MVVAVAVRAGKQNKRRKGGEDLNPGGEGGFDLGCVVCIASTINYFGGELTYRGRAIPSYNVSCCLSMCVEACFVVVGGRCRRKAPRKGPEVV